MTLKYAFVSNVLHRSVRFVPSNFKEKLTKIYIQLLMTRVYSERKIEAPSGTRTLGNDLN